MDAVDSVPPLGTVESERSSWSTGSLDSDSSGPAEDCLDELAEMAALRARELGFLPNDEVWSHPLNRPGEGQQGNLGDNQGGAVSSESLAALRALGIGTEVPGCEAVSDSTSFSEFHQLRVMGNVQDPLDLLPIETPAMSPHAAYDEMSFSVRRALEIEWAAGAEAALLDELGTELIDFHPALPSILTNSAASGGSYDRLLAIAKVFGFIELRSAEDLTFRGPFSAFPPVDRTGTLSVGLRVKSLWDVPAFLPDFSLTLDEVMERRVAELRARHPRLHLLWSGGIDTTASLSAFLRVVGTGGGEWEAAGLSVHYSQRSIDENPRFFERFVRHLPGGSFEGHVRDFVDGAKVVVTGEPADMLFGTTWMSRAFRFARTEGGEPNPTWYALDQPWERVIPEVIRMHGLLTPGVGREERWLQWIRPFIDKSPIPIETVFDFCWWVVFALKWQHDMVRTFLNRKRVTQELWDSVEHFYVTEEWQQWSYHNHHRKMLDPGVWASYKEPLKRYIYDFDGDPEYYAAKIKVPSATYAFGFQLGLDDTFHSIEFGKLSVSGLRLLEKYGQRLFRFVKEPLSATPFLDNAVKTAEQRARDMGFLTNQEAFDHVMNSVDRSGEDAVLDPEVNRRHVEGILLAEQKAAELGHALPGCDRVDANTTLNSFLWMRSADEIHDPLEIFTVETPALSNFRDYEGLRMSVRRALELEWASGPERPLTQDLGTALLAYHPALPYVLNNRAPSPYFSDSEEDRLLGLVRCVGRFAGGFAAVDRTNTLSCGLRVKSLYPMPAFDPHFSLTVEHVMARRVTELLAKHSRLHVLWSGGIDTTAVLVAFFRTVGVDRASWERAGLSVHYGPRAVQEHPKFFQRYVSQLPGAPIEGALRDFVDGSRVVVAGTPADQLFSTAWFRRAFQDEWVTDVDGRPARNPLWYSLHRPWEEIMPQCLRFEGCLSPDPDDEEEWLQWISPWVAKAPIPIKTAFDFGWWVSVSLKWQYDCLRVVLNRPESPEQVQRAFGTLEHFYGSDEWQQWGYHHHATKMPDLSVWASFKEPLKRYICDFDGDAEYYRAKTKVASVKMFFGYQLGVTDSFHSVEFGALSLSRLRMKQKYDSQLSKFLMHE